jgi:glutamate synthase domain-containing protein 2
MKRSFKLVEFKKEEKHYVGNVHDLCVDEDHSYNVNRVIVHNSACLTTQQTAIGYPMASLIENCKKEKTLLEDNCVNAAKIVADGGMQKYSDIIKALALGADYVMLGSILNKALESSADTFMGNKKYDSWTEPGDKIDQYDPMYGVMLKSGTKFFKKYRGMSTKEIQKEIKSNGKLKTSEGIIKLQQVEYTLAQWTENFTDYLRSTMSYCGAKDLEQFRNEVSYNFITQNSLNRFKK